MWRDEMTDGHDKDSVSFRAVLPRRLRTRTASVFFMKRINMKIIKNIQKNSVKSFEYKLEATHGVLVKT
jgi:hypothetical protein